MKLFTAVLDAQEGQNGTFLSPQSSEWTQINERIYYVIKAETHNHVSARDYRRPHAGFQHIPDCRLH